MLNTARSRRGMVTSPHHLASEAGLRVLREGGNAIEATAAMAAVLAVVYPHMTGIGGDWILADRRAWRRADRHRRVRAGGVEGRAGALSQGAFRCGAGSRRPGGKHRRGNGVRLGGRASHIGRAWRTAAFVPELLEDAAWYAEAGFPVTASQSELTAAKLAELRDLPGFAETFLVDGRPPRLGETMKPPGALAHPSPNGQKRAGRLLHR